jgi:hypothetical protein
MIGKKPYHISPERSHSGYSVIVHRVDDETSDPELLRQEISEILVDLVRLARKRGRPRL